MILLSLIQEFCSCYHLDFTASVFQPETNVRADAFIAKDQLAETLQLKASKKASLLEQIVESYLQREEAPSKDEPEVESPPTTFYEETTQEEEETIEPQTPPSPGEQEHSEFMNKYKDKFDSPLPTRQELESDMEKMTPDLPTIERINPLLEEQEDDEDHHKPNVMEDTIATEDDMLEETTEPPTMEDDTLEDDTTADDVHAFEEEEEDVAFDLEEEAFDLDDDLEPSPEKPAAPVERQNPLLDRVEEKEEPPKEASIPKEDALFEEDEVADEFDFDMDNLHDFDEDWQHEDISKEALDDEFNFDDDEDDDDHGIQSSIRKSTGFESFDESMEI